MAKEPELVFKLSRPDHFKCSACKPYPSEQGRFSIPYANETETLVEAFRRHVEEYHAPEDVNQAAARTVREATKD